MRAQYDVIVIGGGTAGVVAAIQAGRAGCSVLLVEKNAMLGGTMTVQGINAPAHFFAWGKQIIAGIPWELVRTTLVESGQPLPAPAISAGTAKPRHVIIDRTVFAIVCDMAVLAAGVELLFHVMPAAVAFEHDGWKVSLCTKTGLQHVKSTVLIDATGDANVVQMAGLEVNRPSIVQPATLQMYCSGYDADTLNYAALKGAAEKAIAAGELKTTDISWRNTGPESFLRSHGCNANHVRASNAETSEGKTLAEVEARQAVLRMYRFFRAQPGLENFHVDWICSETGIRETVTIKGRATVTTHDYESGARYDDALCYAFYPVDEHLNDGGGTNFRVLAANVLPSIPRGALLPEHSRFLITAGRCLSSEREANSGLRVECPCMAMGQAAGAMAALSVTSGLSPEALPLNEIHALLRAHGAVVPYDLDVSA